MQVHELHEQIRQRYEAWERQAKVRGREEGLRDVLIGLLTQRFGSVPEGALTRIQKADAATLTRWTSRVIPAASLDDVLD